MSPIYILIPLGVIGLVALSAWLKRARAEAVEAARIKLRAGGEAIIRDAEAASFRGAEREFGRVKCDGVLGLTEARLVFVKLVGGEIEIPLARVRGATAARSFLGAARAGVKILIVTLEDDNRLGFYVRDVEAWIDALDR